ncbi:MAG: hypothetical protein K9M56_04280 [Victivallales bacterium]|nr:hypothetical protein [Victivallales bacterium]
MPEDLALNPTIADWASRLDPNGKIARIIEILRTTNEILDDMVWKEGNLANGDKTTIRSGLPHGTWRALYGGVKSKKSTTVQVTDTCGMLEAYSDIDKALAALNGNTAEFRLSEEHPFLEGLNQDMAETLFYGNLNTDPEKFLGFAPRYSSLSAPNGENVIDAGGSGSNNTSIWLVIWGDSTCRGIFPKGQISGLQHEDLGEQRVKADDGGYYQALVSHFLWKAGLSLRDWRYVVRIANIDVTQLNVKGEGTSANLVDLMSDALEIVPSLTNGRAAFYCNKTIKKFLRRQIVNYNNVKLSMEQVAGKRVQVFDETVPVRRCDALIDAEETVK